MYLSLLSFSSPSAFASKSLLTICFPPQSSSPLSFFFSSFEACVIGRFLIVALALTFKFGTALHQTQFHLLPLRVLKFSLSLWHVY